MPSSSTLGLVLSTEPAIVISAENSPWIPMFEQQWFRLLRVLPNHSGYVAQLKLAPGAAIPPHRHSGAVLAINLKGQRKLHTGEIINAGDFVYEPPGNVDTWQAIGNEDLIVHIHVMGDVEYLDEKGQVQSTYNARLMEAAYQKFCETQSLTPINLAECAGDCNEE